MCYIYSIDSNKGGIYYEDNERTHLEKETAKLAKRQLLKRVEGWNKSENTESLPMTRACGENQVATTTEPTADLTAYITGLHPCQK